jgi:hypothetical protein
MFEEYGKQYTDGEMIHRAWYRECIQDTMGRFMLYWGNGERRRAIDELWVQDAKNRTGASYGTNIGFFTGFDEVMRHFVTEYENKQAAVLQAFKKAGRSGAQPGIGLTATHSCTTPLLYIANDGLTARFLGYDLGMSGRGKPDGTADCYFEIGLFFAELIREKSNWKIWHVVEQHDFSVESGKDYNDVPTVIRDPADPSRKDYGDPTVKKEVYNEAFGWEYLFYDMPKPFKFNDEDEGYGATGKVGRKFYERMI